MYKLPICLCLNYTIISGDGFLFTTTSKTNLLLLLHDSSTDGLAFTNTPSVKFIIRFLFLPELLYNDWKNYKCIR